MQARGFTKCLLAGVAVTAMALPAALPAQKPPSAKELVREAEADQKNSRFEAAREKLKAAAAQKPKDKKIAEQLLSVEAYLADHAAAAALTACDQLEIETCEKQVRLAASYAATPRVKDAESKLAARKKEVQDRWDRLQQTIAAGQLAEATSELEALSRFAYLLPSLAAEKGRVRSLRVEFYLDQGKKEAAAQKWDASIESFSAAVRLDAGNNLAELGIASAKLEKEAGAAFQRAQNAFQANQHQIAYESNKRALEMFPARQQYLVLRDKIAERWTTQLMEDAGKLSGNPESLKDNQAALKALETVRTLEPRRPGLVDAFRPVREALQSIYVQKAGDYLNIADHSRIGIAYVYYASAKRVNPEVEFPLDAKLREAANLFARKRLVQILIQVENLSPAPSTYSDVLARRARTAIEEFSLPDLKLRTPQEHSKDALEDPQFIENRPGGRSPVALLTLSLSDYESEMSGGDKPIEKPSKFVSGQETVPNPEYDKLYEQYRKVSAELIAEKPKPGKTTRNGHTQQDQQILHQQLLAAPRQITQDKISDYAYQEFNMSVRALIKLNVQLRDMVDKQLIGSEPIEATGQQSQVEIAGTRPKDVNFKVDRPARLPPASQLLQDCERNTYVQVQEKATRLVKAYLNRFYTEGEKASREGRAEDALENFLCHWFFFRGALKGPQAQQILDQVKFQTGLDLATVPLAPAL